MLLDQMRLTTVAAPPGINKRIVCNGVYPNELTIRAPNAVTPPLHIYEAALYAILSAHEPQDPSYLSSKRCLPTHPIVMNNQTLTSITASLT